MDKQITSSESNPRKRMGRPPIARESITRDQFETLCKLNPTIDEVAGCLNVSHDTLERWVKNEYGETFALVLKRLAGPAKVSLRRVQMKAALNGNPTMMIWLGKQWLGQADKLDSTTKDVTPPVPIDMSIYTDDEIRTIAEIEERALRRALGE